MFNDDIAISKGFEVCKINRAKIQEGRAARDKGRKADGPPPLGKLEHSGGLMDVKDDFDRITHTPKMDVGEDLDYQQVLPKERRDLEADLDVDSTGVISSPFLIKAVQEKSDKNHLNYFPLREIRHIDQYAGHSYITFNKVEDTLRIMRIFQANLQQELFGDLENVEDKYLKNIKLDIAPYLDDIR
jgi:hypothetical protein